MFDMMGAAVGWVFVLCHQLWQLQPDLRVHRGGDCHVDLAVDQQFPDLVAQADEELGYSISELCLEDSADQLDDTKYTQPALYTVNCLSHLDDKRENGDPDFVAGHSLGEYSALFAAGAFDFIVGLQLVKKRGDLMGKASGGGMAAVIGMDDQQVADVIEKGGYQDLHVANLNTQQQIVITGAHDSIVAAESFFKDAGAKMYIPLTVSGAFHSPFMQEAKEEFAVFLEQFEFSDLSVPVVSNVTAQPYEAGSIKDNLAEQITHSVRWCESIKWLLNQPDPEFQEIGPGKVLTGMLAKIRRSA